jgi:hypothetical protein
MQKMKQTLLITFLLLVTYTLFGQDDAVTIEINDTIHLALHRTRFDTTGKKLEFYDNRFLYAIDGRPSFGTDGEIPKFQLSKAILTIGKVKYDLQVSNMYNPWIGVRPIGRSCNLKIDGPRIRIRHLFSDGAGTYGAEWLIRGKSSIRTILTDDEDVIIGYFNGLNK